MSSLSTSALPRLVMYFDPDAPRRSKKGETEGDYNARVAGDKDWLLLDKALFIITGNQKVEVCDMLTPDPWFLCVKKMSSSATLASLAQAGVSPDCAPRVWGVPGKRP